MDLAAVCGGFALGRLVDATSVAGGLSNDLWRVETDKGVFAVKVMVAHADRPEFAANLDAAFQVELRAFAAGVAMPEPIPNPDTGGCLLATDGRLARAHRWVDGDPVPLGTRAEAAARLLAQIHAAGERVEASLQDSPWTAEEWRALAAQGADGHEVAREIVESADLLARLEEVVSGGTRPGSAVCSHRDLDPKNTMLTSSGLVAVDWDAAGPVSAAREAVQVALDWTTDPRGFASAMDAYRSSSPHGVPAQPWVFGGWVSAYAGWLVYNVSERLGTELGTREATSALHRLQAFAVDLPTYVAALG